MHLTVNGVDVDLPLDGTESLLQVLREQLQLTGTKPGCEMGECGACTVLHNSVPVMACLMPACRAACGEIETIEGLAESDPLVAELVADLSASQCGYCTPGQIATIVALVRSGAPTSESELRRLLSGNICRCTGYTALIEVALRAVESTERRPDRNGSG